MALGAAIVVDAGTPRDAAEVEPHAAHARTRERVEESADHDRTHRAAVLGMRMAQHCTGAHLTRRIHRLGLEHLTVGSVQLERIDHSCAA